MTRDVYIEAVDLSFRINERLILDSLNFEARSGQVYGLFGPNGSGKTTIFNLLCGIYKPTSGRIILYGEELGRYDPLAVSTHKAGVARTFQVPAVVDELSVSDNLLLSYRLPQEGFCSLLYRGSHSRAMESKARREIVRHLEMFGLESKANAIAGALSYGERRLVTNIGALLSGAKIVLLDEPFANVHPRHIATLKQLLRDASVSEGRMILLIEHLPDNLLGVADVLLQLRERRIQSHEVSLSSPAELVKIIHGSLFQYG